MIIETISTLVMIAACRWEQCLLRQQVHIYVTPATGVIPALAATLLIAHLILPARLLIFVIPDDNFPIPLISNEQTVFISGLLMQFTAFISLLKYF
ncbi:MAG: hypothetical protein ABFC84_03900 [Veillonellales bacterium]